MACSPAAFAEAVLSNGLSPISSSTTSFPLAFRALATARTVKAVSTLRFLANSLSVTDTGRIPSRRSDEHHILSATKTGELMSTSDRRLLTSTACGLVLAFVLWTALTAQTTVPATASTKPDETRFTPVVLVPHGELDEPMVVAVLPDERALIIERKGGFKVYDPTTKATSLIATIPVNTKYYSASGRVTEAEEGLIGLTIDPNFSKTRWVYMKYADPQVAKWVLARWELQDVKTPEGQTK